jgi:hypothetical protein
MSIASDIAITGVVVGILGLTFMFRNRKKDVQDEKKEKDSKVTIFSKSLSSATTRSSSSLKKKASSSSSLKKKSSLSSKNK